MWVNNGVQALKMEAAVRWVSSFLCLCIPVHASPFFCVCCGPSFSRSERV